MKKNKSITLSPAANQVQTNAKEDAQSNATFKRMDEALNAIERWLDLSKEHHALVVLVDGQTGRSAHFTSHAMNNNLTKEQAAKGAAIVEVHNMMMACQMAELAQDEAIDIEYFLAMLGLGEKDIATVVSPQALRRMPEWLKKQYEQIKPLW